MSLEVPTQPERRVPWMAGYLSYPWVRPLVEVRPVPTPEQPPTPLTTAE